MTTYADYKKQIADLQAQAEEARKAEIANAREKIATIMREHGLSLADLSGQAKAGVKVRKSVEIKYRNEATGDTWTGRGRAPKWLEGKDKNSFLVQSKS